MKYKIVVLALFIFTINIYGQNFENGTIITKRYDTIANVKIEKFSDAKSLVHIEYIDNDVLNVDFNMATHHDHGVSFRIDKSRLHELFDKSVKLI